MIEVVKLSKRFAKVEALSEVTLTFNGGAFISVIGPSGAGKTTLLRSVVGLMRPDEGEVFIDGLSLLRQKGRKLRAIRQTIAPVFQGFQLISKLSALSNVLVGRLPFNNPYLTSLGIFPEHEREFARECLERVGLLDKADQRAETLSGGEQQRVAIARGLAQKAKVIYADEPVASVDPENSRRLLTLLRMINREEQVTVICNLHQVELAIEFSDTIVALKEGKVFFERASDDISSEEIGALYSSVSLPSRFIAKTT
ncbi:MAG: phosphonate ABC transporter ATP-binding protein [Candidatus Tectomicrobia bacterium]|nr:phosphonate ABC transporter ATP-binding protein [Candidatus Tectomicrobia bacterium]